MMKRIERGEIANKPSVAPGEETTKKRSGGHRETPAGVLIHSQKTENSQNSRQTSPLEAKAQ